MTLAGSLGWNGHHAVEQGLGACSKHPMQTALKVQGNPADPDELHGPFFERDFAH